MVGASVLTLGLSRVASQRSLVFLMILYAVGNALSALAPSFGLLIAARIVTSLAHGAFFGIGSVVAASLVPRERQASAVAAMLLGLTVANIGGVPASTWLGQAIGWRAAFFAMAGAGVITMLVLLAALPRQETSGEADLGHELRVLAKPAVLTSLLITTLGFGAMFTLYTFIAPVLTALAGAGRSFVTVILVLTGIGFTIGNALGERWADRSIDGSLLAFLSVVIVTLIGIGLLGHSAAAFLVLMPLWGAASFALVPPLQSRVMQAATDAPALASSVNIGAFNLGNAIGAFAGGVVLREGWGYAAILGAGAVIALLGFLVVLVGRRTSTLTTSSAVAIGPQG
jgi:DHA1 family inner membrane transport protein